MFRTRIITVEIGTIGLTQELTRYDFDSRTGVMFGGDTTH